jgi:hypothetical protein
VKRLKRAVFLDYRFLALYWLTFLGMAVAISRRDGKLYRARGRRLGGDAPHWSGSGKLAGGGASETTLRLARSQDE